MAAPVRLAASADSHAPCGAVEAAGLRNGARPRFEGAMQDGILSIQSAVAYGHVGNSAAVFPLQRLGFEVWPVNTVLFSNHTGYGAWRGRVVALDWVEEIIEGIAERGAIPARPRRAVGLSGRCRAWARRCCARWRACARERPDMLYACDPVMGDEGRGFFVRPGIPEFFRDHAVPAADIVTPNQFELAWLAGRPDRGPGRRAGRRRRRCAPPARGSSSAPASTLGGRGRAGHPGAQRRGQLALPHAAAAGHAQRHRRRLHRPVPRLLAARRASSAATLEHAVAAMYALVEATHAAGSRELELVAAQDQLLAPTRVFVAERVG